MWCSELRADVYSAATVIEQVLSPIWAFALPALICCITNDLQGCAACPMVQCFILQHHSCNNPDLGRTMTYACI